MTSSDDGRNQACGVAQFRGHAANGVEHGGTGIGLSEERGATRCFSICTGSEGDYSPLGKVGFDSVSRPASLARKHFGSDKLATLIL